MLHEAIKYLEGKCAAQKEFSYEIIVVSDASTDDTVAVANSIGKKLCGNKLRVLDLEENRGKGGAVRSVRKM